MENRARHAGPLRSGRAVLAIMLAILMVLGSVAFTGNELSRSYAVTSTQIAADGTYSAVMTSYKYKKGKIDDSYTGQLTVYVSDGKISGLSYSGQDKKGKIASAVYSSDYIGKQASVSAVDGIDATSSATPTSSSSSGKSSGKYYVLGLKEAIESALETAPERTGGTTGDDSNAVADGTYEGSSSNSSSKEDNKITVSVTVKDGKITDVSKVDEETTGNWDDLLATVRNEVVGQTAAVNNIDAVSSATEKGWKAAIQTAVRNALNNASESGDPASGDDNDKGKTEVTAKDDDNNAAFTVKVTGTTNKLPEGTNLVVTKKDNSDSGAVHDAFMEGIKGDANDSSLNDASFSFFQLYDIHLEKDGKEYEPVGSDGKKFNLNVTITFTHGLPEGLTEGDDIYVGHYADNGTAKELSDNGSSFENSVKKVKIKGNSIRFHLKSFSEIGIAKLAAKTTDSDSDAGKTIQPNDTATIKVGETVTLSGTYDDSYNYHHWTSDDEGVAKVQGNGSTATVTGVKAGGPVTITHEYGMGESYSFLNSRETFTIYVVDDSSSGSSKDTDYTVGVGNQLKITPEDLQEGKYHSYSWTVSEGTANLEISSGQNEKSVTVKGLAAGTATLTLTHKYGKNANHISSETKTYTVQVMDGSTAGSDELSSSDNNIKVSVKNTGTTKKLSGKYLIVKKYTNTDKDYKDYLKAYKTAGGSEASLLNMYHIYVSSDQAGTDEVEIKNANLDVTVSDPSLKGHQTVNVGHFKKEDNSVTSKGFVGDTSSKLKKVTVSSDGSITFKIQSFSVFSVSSTDASGSGESGGDVSGDNGLVLSKTAKAAANDTYRIDLSAYAKSQTVTTTSSDPQDIVMVLDMSGSMSKTYGDTDTTKLEAMKTAANNFLAALKNTGTAHKVAIVTYNGNSNDAITAGSYTVKELTNIQTGYESLKGKINSFTADYYQNGTSTNASSYSRMMLGLSTAKDILDKDTNVVANDKGVMLYSDGLPNYMGGELFTGVDADAEKETVNQADLIKNAKYKLYTVTTADETEKTSSGEKAIQYMADLSSGDGYHASADNASDLNTKFTSAATSILGSAVTLDVNDALVDLFNTEYFNFDDAEVTAQSVSLSSDSNSTEIASSNVDWIIENSRRTGVRVTGFNYSAHHEKSSDPRKIVVSITGIKVANSVDRSTAHENVPTNLDKSGVYDGPTEKGTLVASFDKPTVDIPAKAETIAETSDGSNVTVRKNVENARDSSGNIIKDEFIVNLGVDVTRTDVESFTKYFSNTSIYTAKTSNSYHEYSPGDVVKKEPTGSTVTVSSTPISGGKSGTFKVVDENGKIYVDGLKLYWSKSNNFTMYIKLPESTLDGQFLLVATSVDKKSTNNAYTVILNDETVKIIEDYNETTSNTVELKSLTDMMGEYVNFADNLKVNEVSVTGDNPHYDESTRTLTWDKPELKKNVNPEISETTVSVNGMNTKTTAYFYKNIATLSYHVKLNTSKDGFKSGTDGKYLNGDSANDGEASKKGITGPWYNTNTNATLTYTTSDSAANKTINFPTPLVQGTKPEVPLTGVDLSDPAKGLAAAGIGAAVAAGLWYGLRRRRRMQQ